MPKYKSIEDELNAFLDLWDRDQMMSFYNDTKDLIELYEDEHDLLKKEMGEENERSVRMIRTIYLVSRIAEYHSGRLCSLKVNFKDLWKRLEKF